MQAAATGTKGIPYFIHSPKEIGCPLGRQVAHHDGIPAPGRRRTRTAVVGGETHAEDQEEGQGPVFLHPVHPAGDFIDPHEHRDQQGHQGVFGKEAGGNGNGRIKR